MPLPLPRLSILTAVLLLILGTLHNPARAQINYTQGFSTGSSGWTSNMNTSIFFFFSHNTAVNCGPGSAGALRTDLETFVDIGYPITTASPLIGNSLGGVLTLGRTVKTVRITRQ